MFTPLKSFLLNFQKNIEPQIILRSCHHDVILPLEDTSLPVPPLPPSPLTIRNKRQLKGLLAVDTDVPHRIDKRIHSGATIAHRKQILYIKAKESI